MKGLKSYISFVEESTTVHGTSSLEAASTEVVQKREPINNGNVSPRRRLPAMPAGARRPVELAGNMTIAQISAATDSERIGKLDRQVSRLSGRTKPVSEASKRAP